MEGLNSAHVRKVDAPQNTVWTSSMSLGYLPHREQEVIE